jgi:hypothetical protein
VSKGLEDELLGVSIWLAHSRSRSAGVAMMSAFCASRVSWSAS